MRLFQAVERVPTLFRHCFQDGLLAAQRIGMGQAFQGGIAEESRIRQARLKAEMAKNEMHSQSLRQETRQQALKEQIRNLDRQLSHYRETGLESSETLMRTATLQFEKQEIEYFEFIQAMSVALDIQRAYLDKLNLYNQAAIEFEYLTK